MSRLTEAQRGQLAQVRRDLAGGQYASHRKAQHTVTLLCEILEAVDRAELGEDGEDGAPLPTADAGAPLGGGGGGGGGGTVPDPPIGPQDPVEPGGEPVENADPATTQDGAGGA